MPSNKDLIAKIKDLDPNVHTEGLVNKKLVEVLKALEEKDYLDVTEVESAEPVTPEVHVAYRVAKGHAIVGRRGMIGPGEAVLEIDGADLKRLLEGGIIELA